MGATPNPLTSRTIVNTLPPSEEVVPTLPVNTFDIIYTTKTPDSDVSEAPFVDPNHCALLNQCTSCFHRNTGTFNESHFACLTFSIYKMFCCVCVGCRWCYDASVTTSGSCAATCNSALGTDQLDSVDECSDQTRRFVIGQLAFFR
jgi:hypothetical protein